MLMHTSQMKATHETFKSDMDKTQTDQLLTANIQCELTWSILFVDDGVLINHKRKQVNDK